MAVRTGFTLGSVGGGETFSGAAALTLIVASVIAVVAGERVTGTVAESSVVGATTGDPPLEAKSDSAPGSDTVALEDVPCDREAT